MNKTTTHNPAPSSVQHQGRAQSNQALTAENSQHQHQPTPRSSQVTPTSSWVGTPDFYLDQLAARRRSRLQQLIDRASGGNVPQFAAARAYSKSAVYQFLSPNYNNGRSIGEAAARSLEHRCGLPFGWLDQVDTPDGDAGIPASASVHDQHQLAAQHEVADATARAGAMRAMTTAANAVPALAGTFQAPASGLALHPLEVYAGIVQHQGAPVHLILLPADVQVTGLEVAEEFVASISGEFPTYAEFQHLRNCMHHRFKPSLYYTGEQELYDGDMATVIFDMATDDDRKWMTGPRSVRARAVRRIPAQVGTAGVGALSAARVAEIADKLIDQESLTEDPEPTNDEYLVATGIKVGIGRMALATQAELAIYTRKQGGSHA